MKSRTDKAIYKIIARLEEEVEGCETIRREGAPLTSSDYDDLAMAADSVLTWAQNLANFAAMAAEDELSDDAFEKLVPIDY